jgi:hypothetical protein
MASDLLRRWQEGGEAMIWLPLAFLVLVIIAGPLRRRFLAAWHFTLPATAGFAVGIALGCFLVRFGLPAWVMLFAPAAGTAIVGSAGKAWLDDNFGSHES